MMKAKHFRILEERVAFIKETLGQAFINNMCSSWAKDYANEFNHGKQLPHDYLQNQNIYIYKKVTNMYREMHGTRQKFR